MDINLKAGKNVVVIPEQPTEELRPGTAKAGVLYTRNIYTPEEQGRKPKIRIEGAERYPHYIKGVDTDEAVMAELEEYVKLLEEDPSLTDTFDVFSDKTLVNVKATFETWVDGQKKYESGVFKSSTENEFVKVNIENAKEVKLITTDADNNINNADQIVWADAKFTLNNVKK